MERFRTAILGLLVVLLTCTTLAQNPSRFRSGMFFHLSTGRNIWDQAGATTSVPAEIHKYNLAHGLSGADSVSLRDTIWWPQPDNMWSTWHMVFDNNFPPYDVRPFYTTEKIIMIKACFPSSNMSSGGIASDTLNPTLQNVYNFKWHWRSIIRIMRRHPLNFFVIWTNAPQVASQTSDAEATAAEAACRWAKDTLAVGLDATFGAFPANVYVFDFFHKLAFANGKLDSTYQTSSIDAHPNAAATNLVAPQLVKEVFDASMAYENGSLPIVLSSFTAVAAIDGSVALRWKTLSEINNYGFLVEQKASRNSLFTAMPGSFIAGHGTSIQPQEYQWTDLSRPAPPVLYRLREVNLDGSFHLSEPVRVDFATASESAQVPAVFSLKNNYPNPFNSATVIEFSAGHQERATLTLYNSLGQSVGTLFDGVADPGHPYQVKFDGTNLASGVYFYRLSAKDFVETKKLLLAR